MCEVADVIAKKRDGGRLTLDEIQHVLQEAMAGRTKEGQMGALLMACHLKGLADEEVEMLMRAMMFSGELLLWPRDWTDNMASLQSTGSTGNKAKLILAPAMAACGLKFPILSSRGRDMVGGVLSKLSVIPGFDGSNLALEDITSLLTEVGCCVVQQPDLVAPAERLIRDIAVMATVNNNNAFKEACMVARVGALRLNAIVIDIPYGPGESIKSKQDANTMAITLMKMCKHMSIKCHVVMSRVDRPVGESIGQSLEVAEAIRCLNGDGPHDLHQLVCQLGGHILREAGHVTDVKEGSAMVEKKIKDGSAKKKFGEMLQAQGVNKSDVKYLLKHKKTYEHLWSVLPTAEYFTHLSTTEEGYVHHIDTAVCSEVMYELVEKADLSRKPCVGGIQIFTKVGAHLNKGEPWGKVHHNTRLTTSQINRLREAITLQHDTPPDIEKIIVVEEATTDDILSESL